MASAGAVRALALSDEAPTTALVAPEMDVAVALAVSPAPSLAEIGPCSLVCDRAVCAGVGTVAVDGQRMSAPTRPLAGCTPGKPNNEARSEGTWVRGTNASAVAVSMAWIDVRTSG